MWPIAWFLVLQTDPTTHHARAHLSSAELHERANQLASAWHEVSRAKEMARSSPDRELRQHIEMRVAQLLPRVGYRRLDVRVMGDVVVEQNGVPVPAFEWGHAEPIDSGTYVWTARMGGLEFWRFEGTAGDGTTLQVTPELPYMPPSDDSPN